MNDMYVVRGITKDGKQVFYTGKAGSGFVSDKRGESFGYVGQHHAQERAKNLNRMTELHGIHFIAMLYGEVNPCA